jgi:DNA-binding NarL/FixJ family response regulator
VRVLVVDDSAPFRAAVSQVIEATQGFAVAGVVESGEESIVAASAGRVDLVLMDVNLPGIDGLTASARLSKLPDPPVVVLVSTHDEEEFSDRLGDAHAAAYLSKSAVGPDSIRALWAVVTGSEKVITTSRHPRS